MAVLWTIIGITLLLRFARAIGVSSPAVHNISLGSQHRTPLPSEDSFYQPPKGFETARLGSILRHRAVLDRITLNNRDAIKPKEAWQLLYRTQNSVLEPAVSVVTVLVPHHSKPNHLLSYAMFSDSAFNGCNPSVTLQLGTRDDNQWNQIQIPIIIQGLTLGYYVSVADYAGYQAAFSAGPQAAYATLDSLRAVYSSTNITGINPEPITTLHGYSSGAQAIGWATEMHPSYAPELRIAGAAFGGTVPNLPALTELPIYRFGDRASLGPPVTLGLSHDYANLTAWLQENLIQGASAEAFRTSENQCISANGNFSNQNLGRYLKSGYNAIFDEVPRSVFAIADVIVDKHCKNGADILYEKNPLQLNHRMECIYGIGGAYRWMMDRHEGKPIKKGCAVKKFSTESLKALSEGLIVKGVLSSLWASMGFEIGPWVRQTIREVQNLHSSKVINTG